MMVNLRLSALGRFEGRLPRGAPLHNGASGAQGQRRIIFDHAEQSLSCPIFLRDGFKAGDRLDGPAVIEELGATILLYPGDKMQVNEFGHLVIDVAG